ncbi:MAG: PQQ-binding-like beta-propeller repeat protein [Bacteroidota bacterium]
MTQKGQIHFGNALHIMIALLLLVGCSQWSLAQQEMWMSSTDANIIKRASKQSKPLFQLPLGHSHVESMQLLEENLLFVGLRETTPQLKSSEYLMVHAETGEILWRWPCQKGDYSTFWITKTQVILQKEDGKKTTLLALDKKTGGQVWSKAFKKGNIEFLLAPVSEHWITYAFEKDNITVESFSLKTGNSVWKNSWSETFDGVPFALLDNEKIFVFKESITAIDVASGEKKYSVPQGRVQNDSYLIPSFDNQLLYYVDQEQILKAINKADGAQLWEKPLDAYSTPANLSIAQEALYVRTDGNGQEFQLLAIDKKSGEIKWNQNFTEALTSNLLEVDSTLYAASASTLYAAQRETGEIQFKKNVTRIGQSFPTALRQADSTVVFVGELTIAGFNHKTGRESYKYGFSPVELNLHLNGLDSSLPRLQKDLSAAKNIKVDKSASTMASKQRAYYQKMSDESYSDYLKYRREKLPGSDYRTSMARYRSRMYSGMARMQAGLSVSFAILELGSAFEQMMKSKTTEAEIRKQEYFRKSILAVYQNALKDDVVIRPNYKNFSRDDNYVSVSVITLATGKRQDFMLSPQYREYGLWNLIDTEKRIIYHHGVGMDPKQYKLSKSRVAPMVSFKLVETFLIAQPY